MIYAIIDAGGKQIFIEPGKFYDLNYINADPGDIIHFQRVLFVGNNNTYHVGQPCVKNITVEATILKHLFHNKIVVYKVKPKKNNGRKKGHRQKLTRVFINSIS
uniref:Large ribosomal subunit protein bL21c n=1 Tax=Tolypiocladia glomerulata TaxID=860646 RepID=A0A1Z1MV23_9FLOR|nr:ribosomal protein L21 [Tolypiocladia glomerulata]ARW69661.1 ribosomal protein L21 [Tolypiocladia glomerulata]